MQNYILLLLSLALFGPLGVDVFLPTVPAIAEDFKVNNEVIQSTISLFLLIMGLGQLVAGPLVDKFGRRPVALTGITLYIIGSVIAALSTFPEIFIAARVIQGCAVCCTSVVCISGVRDRLNGDEAAKAYGFINGTLNIVPALAPLLGGILAEMFNWRAPFWFLTCYSIIALLIIATWLPETRPANTKPIRGLPLKQYFQILSNAQFMHFALVNAGVMGIVVTYVSFAPTVLMIEGHVSPLAFSLIFGGNGFWTMIAFLTATKIIPRIGRPSCLLLGAILMALASLALFSGIHLLPNAVSSHWLSYMLPVSLACTGMAFVMGPATSYALEPYSDEAGVASALIGFVQMAIGSALSLIAMVLPFALKQSLVLVMLLGTTLILSAHIVSRNLKGRVVSLES
ncbi:multidrug effflux MFS transporter [Photorhabdus luminescens]|uniref:Bcr/CflA family efflux transporter n=1 Tax=Photorhabdus luminescens subsp. sonorensis TaxID=1173677 RepID=A0A5C4REL0_PHOLU|nr:multidrug effflux MFS transporter [Photorhabdus luminescens]TNH42211.1 Bcr/CflA family efflux MFS transporter [Photorhabdus luminescens subsp. sonorensis]